MALLLRGQETRGQETVAPARRRVLEIGICCPWKNGRRDITN